MTDLAGAATDRSVRVAAVQLRCEPDADAVRDRAAALVAEAAGDGARLVVLPELFASLGRRAAMVAAAEPLDGPTSAWAAAVAERTGCWLVAGSFVERAADGRLFNTSCLFAPDGRRVTHYRKVHLFDVTVPGAETRESDTFAAGDRPVVVPLDGIPGEPGLGLTVCYDLRFPELYRAMPDVDIIVVPSAFTATTGRAHFETLIRARAIENLAYVIAPAQGGYHLSGRETHGDSMIVDPWGVVLDRLPRGSGVVIANLNPAYQASLRKSLPALKHRFIQCQKIEVDVVERRVPAKRLSPTGGEPVAK